jgi:hypothetical protein
VARPVGRDYVDVPPTGAVHRGEAESELTVPVNVSSVDAPKPQNLAPAMVLRTKRSVSNRNSNLDASQSQTQQQAGPSPQNQFRGLAGIALLY